MPKLSALLIAVILLSVKTQAQNISISGSVADTSEKRDVKNAVVALLSPKDSVLYKFTRTDANGKYSFKNVKAGEYVVMTTHPYFADVIFSQNLKEGETKMPDIALTSKSKLLAEVIVKTGSPIRIKGDTTVYTADSFKVRAGANVEELLKKLPGITVDKDGKIMAMGEQVKKVLVDGEEFFGDDPGIATKNLRADAVKEVEVFDKKSDQAAFTGIDDGVKDKTINLKLKDNAKKGYFGKAEAGTDFSNYYNNSVMANAFRGKRKLAGYGIMSNTGKTNLDWNDNQNYGGQDAMNMEVMDGGGVMIWNDGGGDGDSYWNGRGGIPKNWNGGLHYSNKYNDGKQSLNSGYKISKVNSPGGERSYSTTFTSDSSFSSTKITESFTSKLKQSLNLTFETNLDSNNSLKLTARANLNNTKSTGTYNLLSINDKAKLLNTSNRRTKSEVNNEALNTTLLWKHKFKKLSRTLTVNTTYNYSNSKTDGFLYSENDFYTGLIIHDTTDQENIKNVKTNNFTTNITYTEPLAKDIFLSANYTFSRIGNTNDRFTYEQDSKGAYTARIDSLTNSYVFNQTINRPGLSFRVAKKKYNFNIGVAVSFSHFEQDNRSKSVFRKYDYTNFFPTASFYKKLSGYGGIRVNYNGSTKAPSLDQLQPIVDNSDPINKYIGNPDLNQSFTHNININYSFYNVLKEKGMWSGIYGNVTQNAFVNQTDYYPGAQTIRKTVNANGNYSFGLYSNYNFKWKKPNIHISFGPNVNISQNISYIGDKGVIERATSRNQTYSINSNIRKEKENKYEFSIGPEFSWVNGSNSVNSNAVAKYWQFNLNVDAEVTILKKFRLGSGLEYRVKQQDPKFPQKNKFAIWNASLKRSIYKEILVASLSVNDILNERRGYDRNFSTNQYSETFYNTLRRYWMISLAWNFSKNGKPSSGF